MYYKRTISKVIQNASETFPAVLIAGPRQVGKTTVFEHSLDGRTSVSLDDMGIRNLARTDPALFFKMFTPPLLIDEVQYAPELFPHIKMIADREKRDGLFWLTGSQMFNLMKNMTESLAGRVAVLTLQGLSQAEKTGGADSEPFLPSSELKKDIPQMSLSDIYTLIHKGSYPKLIASEKTDWNIFYSSYVYSYVERDVRQIANVGQEAAFLKFLKVAAARTGQLLNCADMARDVEVSVNTTKSWLSVLETSGLIYLLRPYSSNMTSRAVKTPKLYFFDTGLACWLTGWETPEVLQNGAMNGAMLETYVVTEIIKSYWHNGKRANVWFYRDRDKREIDLLIERNGTLHPAEIKRTAAPKLKDVRSFDTLERTGAKIGPGALVCLADTPLPLSKNVTAMPVAYI
jgi:predicted AAA+ superfamily ATPase